MSIRYLDLEALLRAANAHPEITLYLIGPRTGNLGNTSPEREAPWERLISLPNVQWVGGVPSGSIPEWLAAMDLLLVAYDSGRFTVETAHPHKVMEYLQSGRPVLATFMRDMQAFNDQLIMLPCGVPVDAGIGDVLSRLPELLEPDRVQARRDSVRNLTYPAHVRRIIRYLDSVPMRP